MCIRDRTESWVTSVGRPLPSCGRPARSTAIPLCMLCTFVHHDRPGRSTVRLLLLMVDRSVDRTPAEAPVLLVFCCCWFFGSPFSFVDSLDDFLPQQDNGFIIKYGIYDSENSWLKQVISFDWSMVDSLSLRWIHWNNIELGTQLLLDPLSSRADSSNV